ncbi:hypothetical protein BC628DRAFT_1408739 [Trametes gibbosa]|nr:hypothetical protein BC628DRAFT_1408739 [Trametes gibbosa]
MALLASEDWPSDDAIDWDDPSLVHHNSEEDVDDLYMGLCRTGQFTYFQYDCFVEIQDHYLLFCILSPNVTLERAVHLRQWVLVPTFGLDDLDSELASLFTQVTTADVNQFHVLELNATVTTLPAAQRNATTPRDFKRLIPEPMVVVVNINHPLAHQLCVKTLELEKPLSVHLAVQESRAKISLGCQAEIKYQTIRERQYFDIINLLIYDLILGTPFLFQHKVTLGLNPTSVWVGSAITLPIEGKQVHVLESQNLGAARQHLLDYAKSICMEASDSPMPPLRAINHTIPLKDLTKKRDTYLHSGRWCATNVRNMSPMLLLTKPGTSIWRPFCITWLRRDIAHLLMAKTPMSRSVLSRIM